HTRFSRDWSSDVCSSDLISPRAEEVTTVALPDFLVIGAPKAGTTALHAALAGHPELFMSPVKEPKFFLTDGPPPRRGGGPGDVQDRKSTRLNQSREKRVC